MRTTNTATKERDRVITCIARTHLAIATLETRNDGRDDFHDLPVWAIRDALRAAYSAGYEQAVTDREPTPSTPAGICPRCGEDDHDRLLWDEHGETVSCQRCGCEFTVHRVG